METRRYRCTNCGNVTRFDVTTDVVSKSFYHFSVGGELGIEGEEVIRKEILEVSCRWCESPKWVTELG
ncbi:hypothetical protein [Ferrithrix thermotolerans]|uniref:hypothetical protein n=1 Tax=Ferrithrix thermotolerans TaxID=209649 RepID=UPI001C4A1372|nr:hypothetical protein [Ferrithrix thermotolerans]